MKYYYGLMFYVLLFSCAEKEEENWTNLIDENLSKWNTYLSYQHQVGYNGKVPLDSLGNEITPIGFNSKAHDVFTTIKKNDTLILRISGEYYGSIFTKESYKNYHFSLKVKWGNKKWGYRKDLLKDSGILYHSIGEPGVEYFRSWMLSQEFQIMEGHMGDYWSQANSAIDIRAIPPESLINAVADKNYPFLHFGEGGLKPGFCLRNSNYESLNNDWTSMELICFENKSIHIVNGHVVMILKNSRYIEKSKTIPLNEGKIQLQSEAGEVFFKDVKIKKLQELPHQYEKFYD
ncbi:hypothetical protein MHTCC0001_14700 [Flavobacteriaceae bacterium MHTCC 0001]